MFVVGTVRQRAEEHDPAGLVVRDQYARCLGKLGAQSLGANLGLRTSFRRTRAQRLGELACRDHGGLKSSLIAVSVPGDGKEVFNLGTSARGRRVYLRIVLVAEVEKACRDLLKIRSRPDERFWVG